VLIQEDCENNDHHPNQYHRVPEFAEEVNDGGPFHIGHEGRDVIDQVPTAAAENERPADETDG
jgi:hypothetical protein